MIGLDGETSVSPERGFFTRELEQAASLYDPRQSYNLFMQLVLLADGVGDDDAMDKWAHRGLEAARAANMPTFIGVFWNLCSTRYVSGGECEEAIGTALEAARCVVASSTRMQDGRKSGLDSFDVEAVLKHSGESLLAEGERYAGGAVVLLIVLHLSRRWPSSKVRHQADDLVKHLERIAVTSNCQEFWSKIVHVLTSTFLAPKPAQALILLGNNEGDWLIRTLAYIGSSLQHDVTLDDAVRAHSAVAPGMSRFLAPTVGAYRRIVAPFFSEYWLRCFKKARFRFSAPRQVEEDFKIEASLSSEERVKHILKTVAIGLEVSLPAETMKWIDSQTSPTHAAD